jgi:hypothetical protein
MGGAMFIATGSFFLGQPQVFAAGPLEWVGLRAMPVLAVQSPPVLADPAVAAETVFVPLVPSTAVERLTCGKGAGF